MKALKILTSGEIEVISFEGQTYPMLKQELNGWIEHVVCEKLPEDISMWIDEEGRLKELDVNPIASFLYGAERHGEAIVGDCILLVDVEGEDGMESMGFNDKQVGWLLEDFDHLTSSKQYQTFLKEIGKVRTDARFEVFGFDEFDDLLKHMNG